MQQKRKRPETNCWFTTEKDRTNVNVQWLKSMQRLNWMNAIGIAKAIHPSRTSSVSRVVIQIPNVHYKGKWRSHSVNRLNLCLYTSNLKTNDTKPRHIICLSWSSFTFVIHHLNVLYVMCLRFFISCKFIHYTFLLFIL